MDDRATLASALSDRYEVLREVGAGGMATVYLARDIRRDRPVAIKVLHPELCRCSIRGPKVYEYSGASRGSVLFVVDGIR